MFEMVARQMRVQGWLKRVFLALAGLGALAAGLLGLVPEPSVWTTGLRIACLILAGIVPLLFLFIEITPEELLRELGRSRQAEREAIAARKVAEGEREAVKHAYLGSIVLYETSRAIDEASDAVLLASTDRRQELGEAQILAILDCLIERKGQLFGINDEQWTFGVYVPRGSRLEMLVTRRWSRRSEEAPHRAWPVGEGHVGQAFKLARELVCRDSSDPNARGFMAPAGENFRDYDTGRYVSFASLPIMIGTREEPLGVLVATSDEAGRYEVWDSSSGAASPDTVEPLRVASNTIATILYLMQNGAHDPLERDVEDGDDDHASADGPA